MPIFAAAMLAAFLQPVVEVPPPIVDRLASELRIVADSMAGRLPLTQSGAAGPVTITAMEARGRELITSMRVEVNVKHRSALPLMRRLTVERVCENDALRAFVERGATFTYILTDRAGETFRASASECPRN